MFVYSSPLLEPPRRSASADHANGPVPMTPVRGCQGNEPVVANYARFHFWGTPMLEVLEHTLIVQTHLTFPMASWLQPEWTIYSILALSTIHDRLRFILFRPSINPPFFALNRSPPRRPQTHCPEVELPIGDLG